MTDFRRTWLQDYRSKGGQSLRMPGGVDLRMRLLRQVPEQEALLFIPELGARLNAGSHRWGMHLGFVASETDIQLRIIRRGLELGGSWGWERFLLPWLTVGPEIRCTSFLWQEDTRSSHNAIHVLDKVAAGSTVQAGAAASMATSLSLVQSLGTELHFRWRPGSMVHVDVGAGAEVFAFGDGDGDMAARVEWPVTLGVGVSLW